MARFGKKATTGLFKFGKKMTQATMKVGAPMLVSAGLTLGQPELVLMGAGMMATESSLEKRG
jgi:hypothetical protein